MMQRRTTIFTVAVLFIMVFSWAGDAAARAPFDQLESPPAPSEMVRTVSSPEATTVVLSPAYQGGFTVNEQVKFLVTVKNMGAVSDSYKLAVSTGGSAWQASLFDATGKVPLTRVGPINPGKSVAITVQVDAPAGAPVGDQATITLSATSVNDAAQTATARLDSAVPTSFAQAVAAFGDMRLNLISPYNDIRRKVQLFFSGSSLALAYRPVGGYVYTWERNVPDEPYYYRNIEYSLLSSSGFIELSTQQLTEHTGDCVSISDCFSILDQFPAIAVAENGNIGFVWVRDITKTTGAVKSNVYFAMLSADGKRFLVRDLNITGNTSFRNPASPGNVPKFFDPKITVTSAGKFFITWVDQHQQTDILESRDLFYAVYSSTGVVDQPATQITDMIAGVNNIEPTVASLSNGKVLLVYTIEDSTGEYPLAYRVFGTNFSVLPGKRDLPGSYGRRADAVQLSNGNILIGWTQPGYGTMGYLVLKGSDFNVVLSSGGLESPNGTESHNISVAGDSDGNGILTWMDNTSNRYLYYALVNGNGGLVTEPLAFFQSFSTPVQTNSGGQGNAPFDPRWFVFLPATTR